MNLSLDLWLLFCVYHWSLSSGVVPYEIQFPIICMSVVWDWALHYSNCHSNNPQTLWIHHTICCDESIVSQCYRVKGSSLNSFPPSSAYMLSMNRVSIGSDYDLSPFRRQAITWTNAGILLIGPIGTVFNEILTEIYTFSLKKRVWKCRLENGGHFVSATICWSKGVSCDSTDVFHIRVPSH